jgi:hypothetical protein
VDGKRGNTYVGRAGEAVGTKKVSITEVEGVTGLVQRSSSNQQSPAPTPDKQSPDLSREALKFLFSPDGYLVREFILEETCNYVDALSRDSVRELFLRLGVSTSFVPAILRKMAPRLSDEDRKAVDGISRLVRQYVHVSTVIVLSWCYRASVTSPDS